MTIWLQLSMINPWGMDYIAGAPVNMRTCGLVHTKFGQPPYFSIPTRVGEGRLCPPYTDVSTKFWKPLEQWIRIKVKGLFCPSLSLDIFFLFLKMRMNNSLGFLCVYWLLLETVISNYYINIVHDCKIIQYFKNFWFEELKRL